MFRKITLFVVPAAMLALMLVAADNSQAVAKGGRGGHGRVVHNGHNMHNHRGFHNRYYGRYFGWGYPSYGYEYPTYAAATVPVCETCAPGYISSYPVYGYGWGYGRFHGYRFHNHNFRSHGGRGDDAKFRETLGDAILVRSSNTLSPRDHKAQMRRPQK